MDQPLSWRQIRPWKTAFTVSGRMQAVCGQLQANGADAGSLLRALLLAAYDVARAEDAFLGADLLFKNMEEFGENGLACLPQFGATQEPPSWDGVTLDPWQAERAYAAIWDERNALKDAGVSHHEISKGVLSCAERLLQGCDEASRRYWFSQFQDLGSRGYALAKRLLEDPASREGLPVH